MAERPSEILTRAADLIRDTAAGAEAGPWGYSSHDDATFFGRENGAGQALTTIAGIYHGRHAATGRWVALLNPAVAGPIEAWLRYEAREFDKLHHIGFDREFDGPNNPALAFARHVLGLENTPEETQ